MFVTLQGGNYTANLYLFLAIYPLYDKENSENFLSQLQCFFKFSQTVGSTFKDIPANKARVFTISARVNLVENYRAKNIFEFFQYFSSDNSYPACTEPLNKRLGSASVQGCINVY